MKFLKHMSENLFITFTGIAALVHSTWSLGTMFSGVSPEFSNWQAMAGWLLPAFFVAFSMDVGQISTSAKIRHQGLNFKRGITFFSFAVGTYYLQFVYIAHHMPSLPIAAGVSPEHRPAVEMLVNAGIWILPLLLPLSTMLYTISDGDSKEQPAPEISIKLPEPMEEPILPLLEEILNKNSGEMNEGEEIIQEPSYPAYCPDCGWQKEYDDPKTALRALKTHQSVHCKMLEKAGENGHAN